MAYPYTHPKEVRLLSKYFGDPEARTLKGWEERGGYQALRKALGTPRDEIVNTVKASGLRGRGGAGFPTGMKWGFMPKKVPGTPHYLICNADESEPGTFKDRELMRWTPHALIEGCVIGAYAINAEHAYIYIRGEFFEAAQVMARAIEEAYAAGYLGKDIQGSGVDIDLTLHLGAGAYICGEETGLLNSLEGRRGEPRVKPPYPAIAGAFGKPTAVNNVESLIAAAHIVLNGADWYKQWGTEKSVGTKLFCVSGHVNKPCNVEEEMSIPFRELIDRHCGGMRGGWDNLLCSIPGGSSVPLVPAEQIIDAAMDFDTLRNLKSGLGTAAVIVLDKETDIVRAIARISYFYKHESCGQCTPCREGTGWMWRVMTRMAEGRAEKREIDMLLDVTKQIEGHTICALGDAAAWPIQGLIAHFRHEFAAKIQSAERVTQ